MNERIRELANKAGFHFDHQYNEATQRKVEVLAELIVTECANIAAVNQAENMNWNISEIIKEHFGV